MLNFSQLDGEYIDYVVDPNPYRHGRFTPGVHLPVHDPQKLADEMPDYVVMLALDYIDEVLEQQIEYRRRGGHFIIPVPELRVV